MVEAINIIGIRSRDPFLPGRLYLTEEGDLTKDVKRAKRVEDSKLHRALKQIKSYSTEYFINPITDR